MIYRSRLPGSGLMGSIGDLSASSAPLWADVGLGNFPRIPIYGTLWLLLIAYLTVFLSACTHHRWRHADQQALEECAQMYGASWAFQVRTVTIPSAGPGLGSPPGCCCSSPPCVSSGASMLMGPHSKVITPSIVEVLRSAPVPNSPPLALLQTLVVALAMIVLVAVTRRVSAQPLN